MNDQNEDLGWSENIPECPACGKVLTSYGHSAMRCNNPECKEGLFLVDIKVLYRIRVESLR